MKICKFISLVAALFLGTISQQIYGEDGKDNKLPSSRPLELGMTKIKLQETETRENINLTDKSSDKKASKSATETKPTPTAPGRKPGTFTVKPLSVNFSSLTFGMRKKSQWINGYPIDPYRSSFGHLSNRGEAVGTAYDLEMGIMATSNIEVFTIVGVSYERPFDKFVVAMSPTPGDVLAFDFKVRRNFEVSLGGRYYWNTEKPYFPFIGLMGTATLQDSVSANVFEVQETSYLPVGPLTLQGRKTLWGGTFQVGVDYQLTNLLSLTLSMGLRYTQRSKVTYTSIDGKQINCRDNRNLLSLPVMASLKLTF